VKLRYQRVIGSNYEMTAKFEGSHAKMISGLFTLDNYLVMVAPSSEKCRTAMVILLQTCDWLGLLGSRGQIGRSSTMSHIPWCRAGL